MAFFLLHMQFSIFCLTWSRLNQLSHELSCVWSLSLVIVLFLGKQRSELYVIPMKKSSTMHWPTPLVTLHGYSPFFVILPSPIHIQYYSNVRITVQSYFYEWTKHWDRLSSSLWLHQVFSLLSFRLLLNGRLNISPQLRVENCSLFSLPSWALRIFILELEGISQHTWFHLSAVRQAYTIVPIKPLGSFLSIFPILHLVILI